MMNRKEFKEENERIVARVEKDLKVLVKLCGLPGMREEVLTTIPFDLRNGVMRLLNGETDIHLVAKETLEAEDWRKRRQRAAYNKRHPAG